MIKLSDLIEVMDIRCGKYPAIFIVNKPYKQEHVLFLSLDSNNSTLQRILSGLGDAPVVYIDTDAIVSDTRGSYNGTKIYIKEANAFFNLGDPDTYGDGFIDFGDIESGDYDAPQFYTYKDMGFYRPGKGLKVPSWNN